MTVNDVARLSDRQHDFPERDSHPCRQYMIASCHRSGSTWLALELWQTGMAGAPWEYFNEIFDLPMLATRFDARTPDDYVDGLYRRRTSPNGVFGVKVMLSQWKPFQAYRRSLTRIGGGLSVVYTTRRNRVAQAISFARAIETNRWHSPLPDSGPVAYDAAKIKVAYQLLCRQEESWEQIFRWNRWPTLRLDYEDLTANMPEAVTRVLTFLDVPPQPSYVVDALPRLERQADRVTDEWAARFTREEADWIAESRSYYRSAECWMLGAER